MFNIFSILLIKKKKEKDAIRKYRVKRNENKIEFLIGNRIIEW